MERIEKRSIVLLIKIYPLLKEIRVNIKKIKIKEKRKKSNFLERFFLNIFGYLAQLGSIHSRQAVIANIIRCHKNLNK